MAAKGKSVEVDGIKLSVDPATLDDFDVVEAIADASDEEADDTAKLRAVVRLFRLVYGGDYGRVKRELRDAHDGRLTTETMMGFFTSTLEALNAKN